MPKFFFLLTLSLLFISCSSNKDIDAKMEKKAQAVAPTVDPRTQYARAISMVRSNKELKDDQKEKLVSVINKYSMKTWENRMKQSQLRAVLVSELLSTGSAKNPRVDQAKKSLQALDADNSKFLGKFIRDFKFYTGNTAQDFQPAMREVLRIQ